jgi:hypothetical protein
MLEQFGITADLKTNSPPELFKAWFGMRALKVNNYAAV